MYEADREEYIELNGVRTKISTWGKWVEESSKGSEDIVIIVTGNPGINEFYNLFAKTIHEKLGYTVWCIGHAGHDLPTDDIALPKFKDQQELYGLKGQVEHKADFFEKYIPKDARIHLIGHSIGCYMILELLDHLSLKDVVSDVYLLFPAIEHLADTPNGKFMTTFVKPIVWLVVFLSWIFSTLPNLVKNILLSIYMLITGISIDLHLNSIRALVKSGVVRRVFFLAFEELDHIKERNNGAIKRHSNKIILYYGKDDGWAPSSYCDKLKADIPYVNAQVCDYYHTFVLKQSVEVANVVSDWIKAKQ